MKNEKRGANGPGEGEFVVLASAVVGEDTVCAFFAPFVDVGSNTGPEKPATDAV